MQVALGNETAKDHLQTPETKLQKVRRVLTEGNRLIVAGAFSIYVVAASNLKVQCMLRAFLCQILSSIRRLLGSVTIDMSLQIMCRSHFWRCNSNSDR